MQRTFRVLVLIALLAGMLAACGETALGPKDTAEKYLQAIATKDFAAAYKLLSVDSQAGLKPEEFVKMQEGAWQNSKIAAVKINVVEKEVYSGSNNRAAVPYSLTLTTEDGQQTTVYNAVSLVLSSGRWGVIWPPVR